MCSFINNIYSSYRLFNKLFGLYRIGKDKPLVVGFMNFYFSDPRYINVNVKVLNYFLFRRIKRFFLSNGFSFNNDWHGFKDWLVLKQIYWKGAKYLHMIFKCLDYIKLPIAHNRGVCQNFLEMLAHFPVTRNYCNSDILLITTRTVV